jgi:hypothetical protein
MPADADEGQVGGRIPRHKAGQPLGHVHLHPWQGARVRQPSAPVRRGRGADTTMRQTAGGTAQVVVCSVQAAGCVSMQRSPRMSTHTREFELRQLPFSAAVNPTRMSA